MEALHVACATKEHTLQIRLVDEVAVARASVMVAHRSAHGTG